MKNKTKQDFYTITLCGTNYYLLKCHDGFLLVDAGWVGRYGKFKKALDRLGIGIDSIKYILLTHHHHDHAALIQNIRSDTNCRVIVHKEEVDYLRRGLTFTDNTRQFNAWLKLLDKVTSPFIRLSYMPVILNGNDIIISDDDYDLYGLTGIRARVIHTPGHSKGSLSLLLESGTCFVGDVAMNTLKIFGQRQRPVEAEDYNVVYQSWQKLIHYGAKTIYPSHGSSFVVDELVRTLKTI
jgi:glyoxylase-like metal-dependent hydrolase (beta-lactamase superfamily II)